MKPMTQKQIEKENQRRQRIWAKNEPRVREAINRDRKAHHELVNKANERILLVMEENWPDIGKKTDVAINSFDFMTWKSKYHVKGLRFLTDEELKQIPFMSTDEILDKLKEYIAYRKIKNEEVAKAEPGIEQKIITLLKSGNRVNEVAHDLNIPERTLQRILGDLRKKHNCETTKQLISCLA